MSARVPMPITDFFDINSDQAFFRSLQRTLEKLKSQKVKDTADVLYLLLGANHLREWICPGFNAKTDKPVTPEQHFYAGIYALPEFKIVNDICNRSKHMSQSRHRLETQYGAMFDDYPDLDSINSFDDGPPLGYSVDGRDLFDIIAKVLAFYEQWYGRRV